MNGTRRHLASWVASVSLGSATWYFWPDDLKRSAEILSSVQKAGFVGMAFAVTAYNLRTRVIDLLLKGSYKPNHLERLSQTARRCGRRLTRLVFLFSLTSICMGAAAFFDFSTACARVAATTVALLSGYSLTSFVYVLFAFERLEDFVLDQAIEDSRQKEIERLTSEK